MKKVLVANRGEIAIRVIRACHDLGLQTVAVYSEADAESLHVLYADEAICIGRAPSIESYLKVSNILSAAEITGADAIHPGYGFLSENDNFAAICQSCGINFIGPSPKSIKLLGDKAQAKEVARKAGCPIIPGSQGIIDDLEVAVKEANKMGYPVFIKAVAGGGGKGIRVAYDESEFRRHFPSARTEAQAAFGNPAVYLEKMIQNPRHVEVQVIGDQHGHYAHLGERDCSIQRRRQKLIEETPCPIISDKIREKMTKAALSIAKEAGYYSAGTVEFLLDEDQKFYFLEMNTRIQVEHTVTEVLTGIDLVREQIRIAQGLPLSFSQKEIKFKGHVFQFRINAEDPSNAFYPSPGLVDYYIAPGGPGVRIDSGCYSGYKIPPNYDAMVAKLICWGDDREHAMNVGKRALREFHIGGIKTTIPFHLYMLADERFRSNQYDLRYIDHLIQSGCSFTLPQKEEA